MISAVIPVYNEAESLPQLYQELTEVARAGNYELEIIFVDDGSTDGSWACISQLAADDGRVRGIRLRRNFGKAAALTAGFAEVRGELVFTLDADLQDDPHEIPNFLAKLGEDCDVVSGWKKVRHDPLEKVIPSRVFNGLVSWLTGVKLHDHNCGFKCYRAEVVREVAIYGELHRFVPVLAAARGFRIGELPVQHRARQHGKSKYGMRRYIKGFLDLMTVYFLTGFQQRPLHLLGTIGLTCFGVGVLGTLYAAGYWVYAQMYPDQGLTPLHQRPLVLYSWGALLFGAQLLSIGFLAELITARSQRDQPQFSVRERTKS